MHLGHVVGITAFALLASLGALVLPAVDTTADRYWVYLGSYSGPKSKGVYRAEFDPATGKLSPTELAAEVASPSFLAIHPTGKFLYTVNEVSNVGGKKGGGVTAFSLDPATGALKRLNQQSSIGDGPCHIVVDKAGKNVLVANYGGGSVAALPIDADGKLREASSHIEHKGSSVNRQRQTRPHGHSINLDPGNRHAFAADLGIDQVVIYRFDPVKGTLTPSDAAKVAPGSGPRHFAFHPTGKHAYVINELLNTVTAFDYDPAKGTLTETQTISTLPEDFKGTSYTAEVVVHPSGKFLYGSNRGHNSIAIFTIDSATGKLTAAGHQGEGIKTPRNFAIDPTGKFLLVGSQDGHQVLVFAIDPSSGALKPTGQVIDAPTPVCIRFTPKAAAK